MYFNRKALEEIQKDRLDLAEKKNKDYSSAIDVIGTTGLNGLATRIFDKAARLLSLIKSGEREVTDESIVDTLKDLGNYSDFGVSISNGTWGKLDLNLKESNSFDFAELKPAVKELILEAKNNQEQKPSTGLIFEQV